MSIARERRAETGAQELLGRGLSGTQDETAAAGGAVQESAAPGGGGGSGAQGRAETEPFQRRVAAARAAHVVVVVVARQRLQAAFRGIRLRRLRRRWLLSAQLRRLQQQTRRAAGRPDRGRGRPVVAAAAAAADGGPRVQAPVGGVRLRAGPPSARVRHRRLRQTAAGHNDGRQAGRGARGQRGRARFAPVPAQLRRGVPQAQPQPQQRPPQPQQPSPSPAPPTAAATAARPGVP